MIAAVITLMLFIVPSLFILTTKAVPKMGYTEISYWKLFAIALYIPIVGVVTICMVESAEQTQITTQLIQKGLIEYRTNSLSGETKLFWISDSTPFSIGQQKENQKEN